MTKERLTSAKHYVEKEPPEIWEEYFCAVDKYFGWKEFSGTNNRTGKEVPGVALYALDEDEGIERILIMRLWPKKHSLRGRQILLEHWPEGHFFGPDTVASLVTVNDLVESEWESVTEDPDVLADLSLSLAKFPDRLWREITSEILTFSEAQRLVTRWFGIDFHP